jgi:hypothetical protein
MDADTQAIAEQLLAYREHFAEDVTVATRLQQPSLAFYS